MPTDPALAVIRACIDRCAAAPDERGRWRVEIKCDADLVRLGTTPAIAGDCAGAARRLGAWLAKVGT